MSQFNPFVSLHNSPEIHGAGLADLGAKLFQISLLDEFIPVGLATGFGHNGRLTLKMLRRFANIPHVLVFGRLQLSNDSVGGQTIEFIPMAVATSFGNGENAPLKMLSQQVNIPHVLCFGKLKSNTDFLNLVPPNGHLGSGPN